MKKFMSLLLSVVMLIGIVGAVDLSAYAEEDVAPEYLTEDDALFFTATFLGELTKEAKAKYVDLLVGNTDYDCREGLHNETEWTMLQDSINKVQSKWSNILKYMPDSVSDSQLAKLGNRAFGYISSTVDIFKNIDYIINEDENILEQAYHSLDIVCDCCSVMGITLGPLSIVISALKGLSATILFLYNAIDNSMETIAINGYKEQLGYCNLIGEEYPEPPSTYTNLLGYEVESEFVYQESCKVYVRASLKRMAQNMENCTTVGNVGEICHYGGHSYQIVGEKMTWTNAKAFCENNGGHLVTLTSQDEDEAIFNLVNDSEYNIAEFWAGGSDLKSESEWYWITGEEWEYSHWGTGEPDNHSNNQHYMCVCLKEKSATGWHCSITEWDDVDNNRLNGMGFVCEWDYYVDPYPTMNDKHSYEASVVSEDCTNDGYTVHKCADCGLEYYSNNTPATGHNYEYTKTVAPTCTAQGYDLYTCTQCSGTEKRNTVSALGHTYSFTKTVAPTCTADGYDLYTCSVCNGTEKRNTVSSTGHNYEVTSNTATCTEAGIKTSVCSNCGDTTTAEVSALGHSYSNVYTAPTCTEAGGYTNTCTRCGDITYNIYEANGHDYGECVGTDYINKIYDEDGCFIETVPTTADYYGKTFHTTSAVGSSALRKIKVSYPLQIRIDKDNPGVIEDYQFYIKRSALSSGYLSRVFAYNENSGRIPQESAIPYTDKDGNLVNMKYVDYKENDEWITGEYILNNNQIVDIYGNVVASSYSETRPHIVYTKDDALELGIMFDDGTVDIYNMEYEISLASGVDGIYTTICNASSGNCSAFGYDDSVELKSGKYNMSLCFYSNRDYTTGDILLKVYDTDKLISKTPATASTDEKITYTCIDCGETHTDTCTLNLADFKIKTVSLSLESSIAMNFKVLKTALDGFDNPCMIFKCGKEEIKVTDYTQQGDYLVFSYTGIAPQMMNDNVSAVLCAEHNGITYKSEAKSMSVKAYAEKLLPLCTGSGYEKLRTLLVDLLNYGAAAQIYMNYETDSLVNAELTEEQKSWATAEDPVLESISDKSYETVESPTVQWKAAGLVLNNSVMLRAKLTAQSTESLTVKISCNGRTFTYTGDELVSNGDGTYYVYCDEIYANEMSEKVLFTVYDNGVQCSNTMLFSAESYAKAVNDNYPGTALNELTKAMMRYGYAAKAYGA